MPLNGGRRLGELPRIGLPVPPVPRSSRGICPALWLLPFGGPGVHPQPRRPSQPYSRVFQLSGLLRDLGAQCDGWELEKHMQPLSQGFGGEPPPLPTLLPPPRQTETFFWLSSTPSTGAEPVWRCCGKPSRLL